MHKSEGRPLKRQEPVERSVPQVLRRRISTEDEVHDSSNLTLDAITFALLFALERQRRGSAFRKSIGVCER